MPVKADLVATVFLAELSRTLPASSPDKLTAGFVFMVRVMLGGAVETGRADHLSNGALRSTELQRIFEVMLPFLATGFDSLGADGREEGVQA